MPESLGPLPVGCYAAIDTLICVPLRWGWMQLAECRVPDVAGRATCTFHAHLAVYQPRLPLSTSHQTKVTYIEPRDSWTPEDLTEKPRLAGLVRR